MKREMFIPIDCIGYHATWVAESKEEEELEDLDVVDLAKTILSVHHEFAVLTGQDPDGLLILQDIIHKLSRHMNMNGHWVIMHSKKKEERMFQIEYATTLVRTEKISLLDAILLLFTKQELEIYGI